MTIENNIKAKDIARTLAGVPSDGDFHSIAAHLVVQALDKAYLEGYSRGKSLMLGTFLRPLDCKPDGTGLDDGPALPRQEVIRSRGPLIIAAWKEGLSTRSVARIFDVSHETVAQIVKGLTRKCKKRDVNTNERPPRVCGPGEEFFNRARHVNFGIDPYCEAGNADYCDDAAHAIVIRSAAFRALECIAAGEENPQDIAKHVLESKRA